MLLFKQGMLVLTAWLLALSASAQEVSKEFRKEFVADKNTTIDISNRYGNVVVTSWNNDKVDIYVKVTIELPDRSRAERLLSMIDIQFNESQGTVSAKTVIDDRFSFSGWGTSNRRFSINYTVKMPYNSNFTLVNRYGNADIDELGGIVDLNVKYGNITVTRLTRQDEKPLNRIELQYGKGIVKEAGWLDVYLRYCGMFEMKSARAVLLDSQYSKIRAGEVSSLVGTSKYDTYNIEKISNIVLETGYTTVNVGTLARKFSLTGSYGSVNVDNVPKGFEMIDIDTRYTGVRIGIDDEASYRLNGRSSYNSIKYDEEKMTIKKRIVENTSTEIEGVIGKEASPASTVRISTSYGSVRLF